MQKFTYSLHPREYVMALNQLIKFASFLLCASSCFSSHRLTTEKECSEEDLTSLTLLYDKITAILSS